jgi:dual specificity phosphatase 12
MQDLNKLQVSVDEILPGLFLGNYAASQSQEFMEKNKIAAIVNCSKDIPCRFSNIKYMQLPIDDPGYGFAFTNDHKVFLENISDIYNFISACLTNGLNILVHCHAGMQRSASVVIYYIIYTQGIFTYREKRDRYNAAVAYVQSKRPIIYHYGQYNNFFPVFKKILYMQ